MSKLTQLADELMQAAKEQEWRENLSPLLKFHWNQLRDVFGKLDELLKENQKHRIFPIDLNKILAVWEKADKLIKIKEIRLDICNRGYGEYGGVSFKSPQELQKFISEWDSKTNVVHQALTDNPHNLIIEFGKDR